MPDTMLGFLGLGVMGGPMARNLVKAGYPVAGFDTDAGRLQRFASSGGRGVKSATEAVAGAEVVLLSLPTGDIVREVVMGMNGLLTVMKAGTVVVDLSTTEPKVAQDCALAGTAKGVTFLDSPVSGGEQGAIDAALSIMVGGDATTFARVQSVLACLGKSVVHMGGSGMGQATKLINNMIVAANFASVCEAWGLAVKMGLDPATLHEAIKGGWAGSRVMEETVPRLLTRNFVPGGSVDIMTKDVGYALNMARTANVPVPVTALAHELFRMVKAQGKGGQAQPVLIHLWEQWLGITVGGGKG